MKLKTYNINKKNTKITRKNVFTTAFRIGAVLTSMAAIPKIGFLVYQIPETFHVSEVAIYDNKLANHVKEYDLDNKSELEIIMTVMNDIRSNTYFDLDYKDKVEYGNNYRLVLDEDNNHGVCRHMADKFTTSMNLIDPEYKAVNMVVYVDNTIFYNMCDIYGLEESDDIAYDVNSDTNDSKRYTKHAVSVIKSKEYDCYLVVDVTNPSIGVLENGKIHMLNSDSTKLLKYAPYLQFVFFDDESFDTASYALLGSLFNEVDYDTINNEYGLDAQNEVLEHIKTIK